jgi:hypothetical protein
LFILHKKIDQLISDMYFSYLKSIQIIISILMKKCYCCYLSLGVYKHRYIDHNDKDAIKYINLCVRCHVNQTKHFFDKIYGN